MTNIAYLKYWNSLYEKGNYFGTGPTKLAIFAESIIKTKNIQKILDMGCGQGRDTLYFSKLGYHVSAIDISEKAIEHINKTKEQLNLNHITATTHDIEKPLPFQENSFDFVYSNLALQFFDANKLEKIFSNVMKIMKKDSLFLFSTKKEGDKYYQFGNKINDYAFEHKGITRYFYPEEVLKNLLSSYFNIIQFDSERHTNLDSSVSVWWKMLLQK